MNTTENVITKQVLVFPRGQLTPKDRERLTKCGIVAVEADDPQKVVIALPLVADAAPLNAPDLVMSLLYAVRNGGEGTRFVNQLHDRMLAREKELKP